MNLPNQKKGYGYATYRLQIIFKDSFPEYLSILENRYSSACKLFINGKEISNSGKTSTNKEDFEAEINYNTCSFLVKDTNEIILQISNFKNLRGGIFESPILGLESNILNHYRNHDYYKFFLLGTILILIIIFLIFWTLNIKKIEYLYSAFFGIALFLRQATIEQCVLQRLIYFDYHIYVMLGFVSSYLLAIFILVYLNQIFIKGKTKLLLKIGIFFNSILSIITILISNYYYKYLILPFLIVNSISAIFAIINLLKQVKQKEKGALFYFIGMIVCFLTFVHDSFLSLELINSISISSVGVIYLFLTQAIVLSIRFSATFKENLVLNNELMDFNKSLEIRVKEQTSEILSTNLVLKNQNEKLEELHHFKEGMINMLVHDLKSPLNSLLNLDVNKSFNDYTSKTIRISKHILNIVKNILDSQQLEAAKFKINFHKFNINETIIEAIEIIKPVSKSKNIKIIFNSLKNYIVEADKELILRIITNLLSNSIKYSPQNSEIYIELDNLENQQKIKISVKDSGIGIKQEDKHKIFEKYYTNSQLDSNGLGLTFCKLAIEAQNGKIGVDDNQNGGSIFWFTINLININDFNKPTIYQSTEIIKLTKESKSNLEPIILELKQLKFYQISAIRKVLKQIDNENEELQNWGTNLLEIVNTGNEKLYNEFLEQ